MSPHRGVLFFFWYIVEQEYTVKFRQKASEQQRSPGSAPGQASRASSAARRSLARNRLLIKDHEHDEITR